MSDIKERIRAIAEYEDGGGIAELQMLDTSSELRKAADYIEQQEIKIATLEKSRLSLLEQRDYWYGLFVQARDGTLAKEYKD